MTPVRDPLMEGNSILVRFTTIIEPAGFGTMFGTDFYQTESKPKELVETPHNLGEKRAGFGTINAGFGNRGNTLFISEYF